MLIELKFNVVLIQRSFGEALQNFRVDSPCYKCKNKNQPSSWLPSLKILTRLTKLSVTAKDIENPYRSRKNKSEKIKTR